MSELRLQTQIDNVDKTTLHKTHKGISFAILNDNKLEYVNIPTLPAQQFKYFYNPSKITPEERAKIIEAEEKKKEFIASIIDRETIKRIKD